jgi:hypothetical protein
MMPRDESALRFEAFMGYREGEGEKQLRARSG